MGQGTGAPHWLFAWHVSTEFTLQRTEGGVHAPPDPESSEVGESAPASAEEALSSPTLESPAFTVELTTTAPSLVVTGPPSPPCEIEASDSSCTLSIPRSAPHPASTPPAGRVTKRSAAALIHRVIGAPYFASFITFSVLPQ